jgi:hypothetical protein
MIAENDENRGLKLLTIPGFKRGNGFLICS